MTTLAAALLAAGASRRFGEASKLSTPLAGRPLVDHAASAVQTAKLSPRIAVLRPGDRAVADIVEARGFRVLENPHCDRGMGESIAVAALYADAIDAHGLLIALGDAPFVRVETFRQLVEAFEAVSGEGIVAARDGARLGCPAIFGRDYFKALGRLRGDKGAKAIIAKNASKVVEVTCKSSDELDDVDSPDALAAAERRLAE